MAVHVRFFQVFHDGGLQAIAHGGDPDSFCGHVMLAQFAGLAKTDNQWHRQGAGTHATFMSAPIHLGGDPDPRIPLSHVKRADSLGAINLVSRERHQVDPHVLHIDGNLADSLCRVAVKENTLLFGDLPDLFDRVDRTNFVVGEHHRNQNRLFRDRLAHVLWIDHSVFVDGQVGYGCLALRFHCFGGVDHSAMFRGRRNNMVTLFPIHL